MGGGKGRREGEEMCLIELDRNDLGNPGFMHGNTVESSGGLHGKLVVGDKDKL